MVDRERSGNSADYNIIPFPKKRLIEQFHRIRREIRIYTPPHTIGQLEKAAALAYQLTAAGVVHPETHEDLLTQTSHRIEEARRRRWDSRRDRVVGVLQRVAKFARRP